jgi:stage III sporulation protein SpoIIIAA
VWVADTSNEIVGGGRIPHHRTGYVLRMSAPPRRSSGRQWLSVCRTMASIRCWWTRSDATTRRRAAQTGQRSGVRLLTCAHGDLRVLVANKELRGWFGGEENVTVGDEVAKEAA